MAPQHLQVTGCEDINVDGIGLLRQCRNHHSDKDIKFFVVAGTLGDFLDEASTKLGPPSAAIL